MKLEQFAMERMQSTYENVVDYNLSESGVQPLSARELLAGDPAALQQLLDERLGYTQSNGTPELRDAVAAMHPGATREHVELTNGGSEANFVSTWHLIEPGDEAVLMVPNYMQTWGLVRAFGGRIREWALQRDDRAGRWAPDLDALRQLVNDKTRLIILCTPNNPTGARLRGEELDGIARIAARHGSWVLSDEVYRGAERDGQETPSMWGRYERVMVTGGLSKAYALPGLRIGWIVGPPPTIERVWSHHDYTSIAPGALSDRLARAALAPAQRARLLERTRAILRENYPVVEHWLSADEAFSWIAPEAGAIVYVRYRHAIDSLTLVNRLREEYSTLIVPGAHFGMDGYIRIGYGDKLDYLKTGLERLGALLARIPRNGD